jgi:hypothetical protein
MPRMRFGPRPTARPRTVVGLWLRAMLMRDVEVRRQLTRELNGGKKGWNYDEPAVVQAICELMVRRFFGTNYDVREITAAVSFMRAADQAQNKTPHGQLEMEAVIRSALGETDVDISGIIPPVLMEIRGAATAYCSFKLALREPDVIQMIAEAERIAFERGWNPSLAS